MITKDERRRFHRVIKGLKIRLAESYQDNDILKYNSFYGDVKNISACGILMDIKKYVEKGHVFHLTFLIPNTMKYFNGTGKVVRSKKNQDNNTFETAINIKGLDVIDEYDLNNFINLAE